MHDLDENDFYIEETARFLKEAIEDEMAWEILCKAHQEWFPCELKKSPDIRAWLVQNFGEPGGRYLCHPHPGTAVFLFRDRSDLEWTLLKWK